MRILLAFRVFITALLDAVAAEQFRRILRAEEAPAVEAPPRERGASAPPPAPRPVPVRPQPAGRSEALTLLAALQREARLIDIVKEPLVDYSDAQIGAAARQVLRDCAAVLDRMFALQPLLEQPEGSSVEVPRGYDPLRFRLTGRVAGEPPLPGRLVHPGWKATRCEIPEWSGSTEAAHVVAPAEVEIA